jgi:hypothetical protein
VAAGLLAGRETARRGHCRGDSGKGQSMSCEDFETRKDTDDEHSVRLLY